jgi:ABC-2 type transport system ATP-binding protein
VDVLQSTSGILDAAVFGNALHLVVPKAEPAIPLVRNHLQSSGVTVRSIEKIRPTLEDVFVSLTTEGAQARAAEVRA